MTESAARFLPLRLRGCEGGEVRRLPGFLKGRHTVPEGHNAATEGFAGRIGAALVAERAEERFQAVREAFAFKRREVELSAEEGSALLVTPRFRWQLVLGLDPEDCTRWQMTSELHELDELSLLGEEPLNRAFPADFETLVFPLERSLAVEALVDACEEAELPVDYPGDCRECALPLTAAEATLRFDGACMELSFRSPRGPAALLEGYREAAEAFRRLSGWENILPPV